ncbi:MAG: hypothetical protein HFG34_12975 [Eubacterium sp.]|nr:hypothetical protein [Eubacterium sp.]
MEYTDNNGLKDYINSIIEASGLKKRYIADKMGLNNPQQLNNILNKANINNADIKRICDAMGYKLHIDIQPK